MSAAEIIQQNLILLCEAMFETILEFNEIIVLYLYRHVKTHVAKVLKIQGAFSLKADTMKKEKREKADRFVLIAVRLVQHVCKLKTSAGIHAQRAA